MFVRVLTGVFVKNATLIAVALCVGILAADGQVLAGRGKKKSRIYRRASPAGAMTEVVRRPSLTSAEVDEVPNITPSFLSGVSPEMASGICGWTVDTSSVSLGSKSLVCGAGWTFQFAFDATCTGSGGVGCGGLYVRYALYNFDTTNCLKKSIQDLDTCHFFYPSAKCGQAQSLYYYCFSPNGGVLLRGTTKYFLLFMQLSPGSNCVTTPLIEIGPIYVTYSWSLLPGSEPVWRIIDSPC